MSSRSAALLLALAAATPWPAAAGKLGHFAPSVPNIRDYILPSPGVYYLQYNYYYTTDNLRNRDGDRVDTVTGPLGNPVQIDAQIDMGIFSPALVWVPDFEVLGGHLGAFGVVPFQSPSVQVAVETVFDLGLDVDSNTFGLGDVFVQPVWLGWGGKHWDAGFAYGVYAPTGRYEGGEDDNLGLGFWTNQLQATGAWYPFENRATAFVLTGTYEISGNIEDADVTPGDRVTVNWGVSQYLPATSDLTWLFEVGISGSSQWEIEKDRGDDVGPLSTRDRIHAAGLQFGLVQTKWGAVVNLRWQHEFGAHARFEGNWFGLNVGKKF
jgi:hypothetical protein